MLSLITFEVNEEEIHLMYYLILGVCSDDLNFPRMLESHGTYSQSLEAPQENSIPRKYQEWDHLIGYKRCLRE